MCGRPSGPLLPGLLGEAVLHQDLAATNLPHSPQGLHLLWGTEVAAPQPVPAQAFAQSGFAVGFPCVWNCAQASGRTFPQNGTPLVFVCVAETGPLLPRGKTEALGRKLGRRRF